MKDASTYMPIGRDAFDANMTSDEEELSLSSFEIDTYGCDSFIGKTYTMLCPLCGADIDGVLNTKMDNGDMTVQFLVLIKNKICDCPIISFAQSTTEKDIVSLAYGI